MESPRKLCTRYFAIVILLISTSKLPADVVWLEDTNHYTYASTARGTYIHFPGSVTFIPQFSPLTDATWFAGNAVLTSFVDNIDMYLLLLAYLRHGVSQLTINEALENQKQADDAILIYCIIAMLIQARFITGTPQAIRVALEPFSPLFKSQFAETGGAFESSSVFTGNSIFDRQVRMTLLRPGKYNYTASLAPTDKQPWDAPFDKSSQPVKPTAAALQAFEYGYSRSLISLAPTPFHYYHEPNTDRPSGRILQAINLMDRSNGDELLFGKNTEGDFFLVIQSGLSKQFSYILQESPEVINYPNEDLCDPTSPQHAIEPVAYLFSETGSQWFLDVMQCFYMNICDNGRLEYLHPAAGSISSNSTVYSNDPPPIDFLIYQSLQEVTHIPSVKKNKQLYMQAFNCQGTQRKGCKTALFWSQADKTDFPDYIRVVEGEHDIKRLHSDLKKATTREISQQFAWEYPYGYIHPHTIRSLTMFAWAQPAANPFRPLFRKAHRYLLVNGFKMLIKPSTLTPVMSVVPALSGGRGLTRDLLEGSGLAPLRTESGLQLLANIKAQAYYGEMLQNNWIALYFERLRGHSYVANARGHLFGYRMEPGVYAFDPERRRGMLWLAYGVTKMDKPSIQMLLDLNEHEHFISLSPSVTSALKLALKPGRIVARSNGRTRSGRYSLWREQLDRAYQDEHEKKPAPISYRRHMLRDIPEIWKDEEFINALETVEEDLSWQKKPEQQNTADSSASTTTTHTGKGAFRRHFGNSHVTVPRVSQATSLPSPESNRISIQNRDQVQTEIKKRIGQQQWPWVNKILTYLENKKWSRSGEWLIDGKTVQLKGESFPLYHKSRGEELVNNEGNSVTLFFIRKDNQAIILAAGAHPKRTVQKQQIGKQYRMMWLRDGFDDEELKIGKIYTLP